MTKISYAPLNSIEIHQTWFLVIFSSAFHYLRRCAHFRSTKSTWRLHSKAEILLMSFHVKLFGGVPSSEWDSRGCRIFRNEHQPGARACVRDRPSANRDLSSLFCTRDPATEMREAARTRRGSVKVDCVRAPPIARPTNRRESRSSSSSRLSLRAISRSCCVSAVLPHLIFPFHHIWTCLWIPTQRCS